MSVFGPIRGTPAVSFEGVTFAVSFFATFLLAFTMANRGHRASTASRSRSRALGRTLFVAEAFMLIGVIGAALRLEGTSRALAVFELSAIYELRVERALELADGIGLRSGSASAIGFLLYPAATVGLCAGFRWYERLGLRAKVLGMFALLTQVAATVLSGGRSALVVLALVILGAAVLRTKAGIPALPTSKVLRLGAATAILASMAYGSKIWEVRASRSDLDQDAIIAHMQTSWGVTIDDRFRAALEPIVGARGVAMAVASAFYFVQSTSTLERVIATDRSEPMYGMYQADVLAAAWRWRFGDSSQFLASLHASLLDAEIYGFFAGAWGALLIDFGYAGAVTATLVWGAAAGLSWRLARHRPDEPRTLICAFWIAASGWCFVSSPIGFSNGLMLLCWFLAFVFFVPAPESAPTGSKVDAAAIRI